MKTLDTDVLVVGAGPTGMTAGILLARAGLRSIVVEKREGPQRSPAAHVVNARSFEIWRQAGLDMEALLALAKDPADAGAVHWVSHLGGECFGSLPFERQGEDLTAFTPTPLRNLSQHRLEPLLARELAAAAGAAPLYSHRWESSREEGDFVLSELRDAGGELFCVRSRYVIAADGAGSPLRKSLGIDCIGPDRLQAFVMIHFEADLRRLAGDRRGVIYWICDPDCSGTLVAHDLDREGVFMLAWDPDSEKIGDYDEARCLSILHRVLGRSDVEVRVRTVAPWMMTSQTAERYSSGRIFLAGDAAHRFPPTGGLGLNTGVQDVHNLVWKLAALLRGESEASLLASYESERRPVALYNAEQSLLNAMRLLEVPQAMGTAADPESARRSFAGLVAGERRREVEEAIARQGEHFDMLGLQLGFRYEEGALLADQAATASEDEGRPANPVRDLQPSAAPGSRLPHGWLRRGGERISTLDLIAWTRPTLLARASSRWIEAARALELEIVEWGNDVEDDEDWWNSVAGIDGNGALLVRPDQHLLARWRSGAGDEKAELLRALERLAPLGRRERACA